MPTFQYEALNEGGKPQKGSISAANSEEAIARIRSQGYFPTSVREQKVKKGAAPANATGLTKTKKKKKKMGQITINIGGVSKKVLTDFTRQLSTLQDAGLPILRSLAILEQQQKPGLFKDTLEQVHEDVSSGATLSDAMVAHPKAFDKLYCKMITAGEVGGVLDIILERLAEFLEKARKLRQRIIGAMVYPAAVISVAAGIVLLIMMFIVPQFTAIFKDFDSEMPAMTTVLIESSNWLAGTEGHKFPGAIVVVFLPTILFFLFKANRKTTGGKSVLDMIVLKLPVMGKMISKTTIAKFTRTLGTLINAGVPILDAINITRDTTGNYVYQKALTRVHDSVRQGESFAGPLAASKVCDSLVVNMIDVGEETGDLDKMLIKIADNYDEEVDVLVGSLVSLLEPIMVVLLGGIVGFIVVSLFLPLVTLMQHI